MKILFNNFYVPENNQQSSKEPKRIQVVKPFMIPGPVFIVHQLYLFRQINIFILIEHPISCVEGFLTGLNPMLHKMVRAVGSAISLENLQC
jgi:hypothetical protein